MHVREKFKASEEQTTKFLERTTWATIVSTREDGFPTATHCAVICKQREQGWLIESHIALNNPHRDLLDSGAPVLCILQGAHCYVSSYWYEHPSAPTWNYQSVHLTGRAFLMDEPDDARRHLRELVRHMEGDSVSKSMDHVVTDESFEKLFPGIVAFRIEVERIDSALKMSQNKDDATYASIIDHLEQRGGVYDANIASIMRSIRPAGL